MFEAFEVCPRNTDVLTADNALQRDFPGSAVAIPLDTYREDGFIENFSLFLESTSIESIAEFSAFARKADTQLFEIRDSSNPDVITSLLVGFLEANGRRLAPTRLVKMTRDDVCWRRAERPWRRLPYWLVLRVSLGLHLSQGLGGELGRFVYKLLIANLLSTLLRNVLGATSVDRIDFLKRKVCRRLAKLELEKDKTISADISATGASLLARLNPIFENDVASAARHIEFLWKGHKMATKKQIPQLPQFASPEDMSLDLSISGII